MRYLFEDFALDTDRRELSRRACAVPITPQVFDLLDYLIRNRERVVSKDGLIAAIWDGRIVSDSALTTRLNVARTAIGDCGEEQRLIKTLPRKGFRFVGNVREESSPESDTPVKSARPPITPPDKPSIAVLPFANISGDSAQDYFADGITDDIITELSRFSELLVIARHSSFRYKGKATDMRAVSRELGVRYVLRGSIRRTHKRVRIGAQLVDASTGATRWAERYDHVLDDIFAVQDEVARTVATLLAAHISNAEAGRPLSKAPSSWEAHDYYLRASETYLSFLSTYMPEELYEARRLLEKSLSIDPHYARAYALLSNTYVIAHLQPVDSDHAQPKILDRAYQLALRGVQINPNLPFAHAKLGVALGHAGRLEESIAAFERAMALNPNFTDWRFTFPLVHAGQFERAIEVAERCMRLDPFHTPGLANLCAHAHYMLREYPAALPLLRDSASRLPSSLLGRTLLAATCAQLGQLVEARAEATQVIRIHSTYSIKGTQKLLSPFKLPHHAEHFFDGLRKAGLPEEGTHLGPRAAPLDYRGSS